MEYKIQISGLKPGKYDYEFPITKELFREFENEQVMDASVTARCVLDKGKDWANITLEAKGYVVVECDRCLEPLELEINFTANLAVKNARLGEKTEDESDEFIILDPSAGEVDLKQFIYDYICINMPLRRVHKEGKCNRAVIEKLEKIRADEAGYKKEDTYSPFGGLARLLENQKNNKE